MLATVQITWHTRFKQRQEGSLTQQVSSEADNRNVEEKPSLLHCPLAEGFAVHRGKSMLGLWQGVKLHEHASNSLDPEMGQSAQVSPSQTSLCVELKRPDPACCRLKLFQSHII